ncbi:MAG TPA: ABC transporter ATP-binding protein [Candidatus Bariatricus faecipullorum]|nr:ABC transporter ATP-binding protein [Candidatus Bariatricus faecipullorum]
MKLELNNLTKTFGGLTAVDHLNVSMHSGIYGLLGVNGAGKTTLMRMLCTLLKPTEGEILWEGQDIFRMGADYRKMLGYLPQDFGFYPEFSVRDYLLYISSIKGLRPAVAKRRTEELLRQVGLSQVAGRKMKKLSGGMKRRAGIAQAMLNNPRILVLDEPTAGLDPSERIRFRNLISELSEERLVLLSTHIVSDVEYIAGEIWLMKEGRIFRTGTLEEMTESLPEQVWNCQVEHGKVNAILKNYKVSNLRAESYGAELRVISPKPPVPGAVLAEPSLEDVFLYYFGEKAGEKDAEI